MSIKKINPKSEIFLLWIILYFAYCLLIFKIGPGNIIAPNVFQPLTLARAKRANLSYCEDSRRALMWVSGMSVSECSEPRRRSRALRGD